MEAVYLVPRRRAITAASCVLYLRGSPGANSDCTVAAKVWPHCTEGQTTVHGRKIRIGAASSAFRDGSMYKLLYQSHTERSRMQVPTMDHFVFFSSASGWSPC